MNADRPLDLAGLLVLAEDVLGTPAEQLGRVIRVAEAESALNAPYAGFGGHRFYDHPVQRAAILCSRLVRNHPFVDGNKRVAYVAMRYLLASEGFAWSPPPGGDEEIDHVLRALAARELPEDTFVGWVGDRVHAAIPGFAHAQLESGPVSVASRFLDAIQAGDIEVACQLSVPELAERLRHGFSRQLSEKWEDIDGSWGWVMNPKPISVDPDLELVLLVDKGETGWVQAPTEVMALPFVMHCADAWRVYALELPDAPTAPQR